MTSEIGLVYAQCAMKSDEAEQRDGESSISLGQALALSFTVKAWIMAIFLVWHLISIDLYPYALLCVIVPMIVTPLCYFAFFKSKPYG